MLGMRKRQGSRTAPYRGSGSTGAAARREYENQVKGIGTSMSNDRAAIVYEPYPFLVGRLICGTLNLSEIALSKCSQLASDPPVVP
jgi:hypothetical protein